MGFFKSVFRAVTNVVKAVVSAVKWVINTVVNIVRKVINIVAKIVKAIINFIVAAFSGDWEKLILLIILVVAIWFFWPYIVQAWAWICDMASAAWGWVCDMAGSAYAWIETNIGPYLLDTVEFFTDTVWPALQSAWGWIAGAVGFLWDKAAAVGGALADVIGPVAKGIADFIGGNPLLAGGIAAAIAWGPAALKWAALGLGAYLVYKNVSNNSGSTVVVTSTGREGRAAG